jgi:lipopolysaccharide biosynthesis regulator YciM
MRTILLSFAAASAIMAAAAISPASAMTVGTAAGIRSALADQPLVQDAAYVCRHRFYTSRRLCWWRPSFRRWRWHR